MSQREKLTTSTGMAKLDALLPVVFGLAGIFSIGEGGAMALRTAVVIDYENVHRMARGTFDPQGDLREYLIHPMQFARAAIRERNDRQREGYPHAELSKVLVFRGRPSAQHEPTYYTRNTSQATQWRADGAVVTLRELKYTYQYDEHGRVVTDEAGRKLLASGSKPQEKGIDVLCALECVRQAQRDDIDLVVLASRDTDLVPVLDQLHDAHHDRPSLSAKVETVAWFDRDALRQGGSLQPTRPRKIWNTNLGRRQLEASIDRNDYR